jgi:hypothetical protein
MTLNIDRDVCTGRQLSFIFFSPLLLSSTSFPFDSSLKYALSVPGVDSVLSCKETTGPSSEKVSRSPSMISRVKRCIPEVETPMIGAIVGGELGYLRWLPEQIEGFRCLAKVETLGCGTGKRVM